MSTGSFPGLKRSGRGVDHPHSSSAEVKERVELYLYSTSGPSWPVTGWHLPLPFTLNIFTYLKAVHSVARGDLNINRRHNLLYIQIKHHPVQCYLLYRIVNIWTFIDISLLKWPMNMKCNRKNDEISFWGAMLLYSFNTFRTTLTMNLISRYM